MKLHSICNAGMEGIILLLSDLLDVLKVKKVYGDIGIDITGFAMDSRKVNPGNIYVVLTEPELQDRTQFIGNALEAGANCVLADHYIGDLPCTQIVVPETQVASASMAARFYSYPGTELSLVGITGTKGKTTTSYLVGEMLERLGISSGIIGTTGAKLHGIDLESTNTTPHAIDLQRILRKMADGGAKTVSMEVSSHALRLNRVSGCRFTVGIFTNIGHDHMNFHKSVEDYVHAKSTLFSRIVDGVAVINADDPWGRYMIDSTSCERLTYGFSEGALLRASNVETGEAGTKFLLKSPFGEYSVSTALMGRFNVYNCLAALGAAIGLGLDLRHAVDVLGELGSVPGRLEEIDSKGRGFKVFVDYAHTPESMENVLSTLKAMEPRRLITVFGCGGDRDRTRRPTMGKISAGYSDFTLITSDNPRTEDPEAILREIEAGMTEINVPKERYEVDVDRRASIHRAIAMAKRGDIVAILGKGHEVGQIIGREKFHFDDREVAREAIDNLR